MMGLDGLGKLLLLVGGVVAFSGLGLLLLSRLPFAGKLPGDIFISKGGFSIFIPLVTMIVLSLVLTVLLNLLFRILR